MKKIAFSCAVIVADLFLTSAALFAEEPSPSPTASPTASPTPSACAAAQTCVDTALISSVNTCVVDAGCTPQTKFNQDPFALSAGVLAARALALRHCDKAVHRIGCNFCYESAIAPLRIRYDGQLYHGLNANAAKIIREQKKTVCGALQR